jgi:hypothetical protein
MCTCGRGGQTTSPPRGASQAAAARRRGVIRGGPSPAQVRSRKCHYAWTLGVEWLIWRIPRGVSKVIGPHACCGIPALGGLATVAQFLHNGSWASPGLDTQGSLQSSHM